MNDSEKQQTLVLWAYVIQWATLLMPPALIASLIYLLIVRNRVTISGLRTHVNWQLMTCGVTAAIIPIGYLLLYVGLSGVSTDAPISIIATFVLVGVSTLYLPWLLYRFIRGSIRFSKQLPMEKLLP